VPTSASLDVFLEAWSCFTALVAAKRLLKATTTA